MENKDILIFCGVLIVIAFVGWYGNYSANQKINSTQSAIDSFIYDIPSNELKEGFIEGCNYEGGYYEYCNCAYDYMDSRLTNPEMFQMAIEVQKGEFPDILFDAVQHCMEYIDWE